jgi:DNA-binding GntR family transcriptional regulator
VELKTEADIKTLAAQVMHRIRNDIVSGTLAPGTKLHAERLKQRYNVGSSPLREALTQLAANGLVSAEGQKGFRVSEVSLKELGDISGLRLLLEIRGLRQSLRQGDIEWEVAISGAYRRLIHSIEHLRSAEPGSAEKWEDSHRRFHMSLIEACGSPWLISFCHRLYDQFERYRRVFVEYSQISPNILSQHKDLYDAVLGRDEARAVALLEDHILQAAHLTERDARRQGIRDADQVPPGMGLAP